MNTREDSGLRYSRIFSIRLCRWSDLACFMNLAFASGGVDNLSSDLSAARF